MCASKLSGQISQIGDPKVRTKFEDKIFANSHDSDTSVTKPKNMDDRILKVFNALFFEPFPNKEPRLFSWQEFCFAMYAIGFNPSKMYGSLWHFQKGAGQCGLEFQFHEPVETKRVQHSNIRLMGGRLHRQFGWSLENLPVQERFDF